MDLKTEKIISIEVLLEEQDTVDICVSDDNLFIANHILTHNSAFNSPSPGMEHVSECIEVNQLVTLRDGTVKKIGDIEFGDQVIANDGFKTVTQVHHRKIKPCYKITLKSGKEIIVSDKHKFPTKRGRMSIVDGIRTGDSLNSMVCKKKNGLNVMLKKILKTFLKGGAKTNTI